MRTAPIGVELRHLRYFLAVVDELHFGRAAARMHMSQPPLSQAIRKLESELDVTLLNRTSRVVVPTEAGLVFAEHARRVLMAFDVAVDAARGLRSEERVLRVGCVPYLPIRRVHRFLQALEKRLPSWHTDVVNMPASEQVRQLENGALDLGIVHHAAPIDGIEMEALFAGEPLVVFLPKDHPLAAKNVLTPDDLRDEVHVTWSRTVNPSLYDHLTALYEAAGYRFHQVVEVGATNSRDLMLAVASRRGVAFGVPSFDPDGGRGIVSRCDVEPPSMMPDTAVAWRANPPPERTGVIPAIREAACEVRRATVRRSRRGASR